MPKRIEHFYLEMSKNNKNTRFSAKQNEDVIVSISLLDNNKPYPLPVECEISAIAVTPNKSEKIVNGVKNLGNDISINLKGDIIKEEGLYQCEIHIKDQDGLLITPTLYFLINKSYAKNNDEVEVILLDKAGYELLDSHGYRLTTK